MNNKEIWKDIPDYEGLYQISNFGQVKSLKRLVSNGNGIRSIEEKKLLNITEAQVRGSINRKSKKFNLRWECNYDI